ncbi:conserved hypothetical protein [Burkholderia latens]|uniref:hypothetical protein n=1 Tax=Burkholderia latens TaxID=488446 RepID=UPI0039A665E9
MATPHKRFLVFDRRGVLEPVFSSRFQFLALTYSSWFLRNGDYCRVVDQQTGEIILEWARAVAIRKH